MCYSEDRDAGKRFGNLGHTHTFRKRLLLSGERTEEVVNLYMGTVKIRQLSF